MEATRRQLLPRLPPELRNLIYSYTLSPKNAATNIGLPFQRKLFESSHTTVTIMPVHRGLPDLLELQKDHFLEAREYNSYLLSSSLELRIGILFKGNTLHFIQEHWEKKMHAHLKNLVKRYPWMKKVAHYDVEILWAPLAVPRSTKRKVKVGEIASRMVEILSSCLDPEIGRKKGFLKASLHIEDYVAIDYVSSARSLVLGPFIRPAPPPPFSNYTIKQLTRAVYIAPRALDVGQKERGLPPQFKEVSENAAEVRRLLVEENGVVEWSEWTRGNLVFRKERKDGQRDTVMTGAEEKEHKKEWRLPNSVYLALSGECVQQSYGS